MFTTQYMIQDSRNEGGGGVERFLDFGRSGNLISTGGQFKQSYYYSPPDFQTFRHSCTWLRYGFTKMCNAPWHESSQNGDFFAKQSDF